MKRKVAATPNPHLRHERELRGWSQQYVARQIDAPSSYYVSRWERGVISPSPYYRERLCQLFDKSAQELGLLETSEDVPSAEPPAPAPPARSIWYIPYPRNPLFTGREEIFERLRACFQMRDTNASAVQALSGLGGVGKTQTALEYAYRFRQEYSAVIWIQAETPEVLQTDCISVAHLLHLPLERAEREQGLAALKSWLSTQSDYLLILDNVADLGAVQGLLASAHSGHILLTTRLQALRRLAGKIELDALSLEEGTLFLLRRAGAVDADEKGIDANCADYKAAQAIVRRVDGLPLALDQAGAYIEETGCGLADYLSYYKRRRAELLARRGENAADHPHSVSATFSLIFAILQRNHPRVVELLCLCAFLYPDAIPEELLSAGASALPSTLNATVNDPLALNEVLQVLRASSLVRRDPATRMFSLHRLVQDVIKDGLTIDERRGWAEITVHMTSRALPDPNQPMEWGQFQRYFPHIQVCTTLIQQWNLVTVEAAQLLAQAATYVWKRGQWEQVEDFLTRALDVYTRLYGNEHLSVAECLNNFGVFYHYRGDYAQAIQYHRNALAIREQVCGSKSLEAAESLDNLAYCYFLLESYTEAEPLALKALILRRERLGSAHTLVARSLHTLASVYLRQPDRYEEAERYFKEALTLREQLLGRSHLLVAQTLTELADLYAKLQRFTESEKLFRRALNIYEHSIGDKHPAMISTLRKYVQLLNAQKRKRKAEGIERKLARLMDRLA